MKPSEGVHADLYEKVLVHARREIDEASGKIEELRRSLQLLEARVEAAKSVYEAVAARMNLEDEMEGELQAQAYPVAPPPEQAPEPPEEPENHTLPAPDSSEKPEKPEEAPQISAGGSGNGSGGFSMDLIRKHFEQKSQASAGQASASASSGEHREPRSAGSPVFPELSDAERKLIEEHMRSRAKAERQA